MARPLCLGSTSLNQLPETGKFKIWWFVFFFLDAVLSLARSDETTFWIDSLACKLKKGSLLYCSQGKLAAEQDTGRRLIKKPIQSQKNQKAKKQQNQKVKLISGYKWFRSVRPRSAPATTVNVRQSLVISKTTTATATWCGANIHHLLSLLWINLTNSTTARHLMPVEQKRNTMAPWKIEILFSFQVKLVRLHHPSAPHRNKS